MKIGMGDRKIIALLLLQLVVAPALAQPEDTLRPYAEYTFYRDNNYFRLANDAQALALLGTTDTAATIRQIGMGLDADVKISRQALLLRSNVYQVRFDRPELQEQSGGRILAQWNWQLGNDWSGDLSSRRGRVLVSQVDFRSLEANVQDDRETSFNANYRFHPSWLVKGGIGKYSFRRSAASLAVLNHDDRTASLGWAFVTPLDNQIGVGYRYTDGHYTHRPAPGDHFEQSELNMFGVWLPGGHTQIRAEAGYTRREENQLVQRRPTWRLSGNWLLSQITLAGSMQRQIQTSGSVTSSISYINNGGSFGATWPIFAKTTLNASVKAENRDYASIARFDRLRTGTLSLNYQPARSIQLSPVFETGKLNSNNSGAGYQYRALTLNFRASF